MDWTMEEGYGSPIGTPCPMRDPKEGALGSFPRPLSPWTRQPLSRRLPQAYARGALRLGKRLHALRAWAEEMRRQEGAARWGVGAPPVRADRHLLLWQPRAS